MDYKKICRLGGMLALQHVMHFCAVQLYHKWCAYSVCVGLEEFNRRKLGVHILLLLRELK